MTKTTNATITAIGTKFAELAELLNTLVSEGTVPASVKEPKKVSTAVEVEEADENEEAGELTADDLAEMSLAELKEIATENEIEFTKSVKKPALLKLVLAFLESDEEEEGEEEAEEAEEEETEEEEEEVSTVVQTEDGDVDLSTMTLTKLKKFAKEYEIELSAKDKDGVIEEILEAINGDEEEEAEEAEEEGEEELDLDEMSLEELKEFAEDNEIDLPAKKKVQKAPAYLQIVKDTIAEALAEGDEVEEEEEEEEDIATSLGLNEMELDELAELLTDHELSAKGKKQALIARIVKAVEDGTIEVDEEEGE